MSDQLALALPPGHVTWLTPYDKHGRQLPPISVIDLNWKEPFQWAAVAIAACNDLGPEAGDQQLFTAATHVRWLMWSLCGKQDRIELEINHYQRTGDSHEHRQ